MLGDGKGRDPKQARVEGQEERPTLRGLTTGSVKIREAASGVSYIVFGDVFPSWLPVLDELGLRPELVFFTGDEKTPNRVTIPPVKWRYSLYLPLHHRVVGRRYSYYLALKRKLFGILGGIACYTSPSYTSQ